MKLCMKCLMPSTDNIVKRKHKKKLMESTTHACRHCGSYTFFRGGAPITPTPPVDSTPR